MLKVPLDTIMERVTELMRETAVRAITHTGATHVVLFEDPHAGLLAYGNFALLCVGGPNCTYKTVEDVAGEHIENGLLSSKMFPTLYAETGKETRDGQEKTTGRQTARRADQTDAL